MITCCCQSNNFTAAECVLRQKRGRSQNHVRIDPEKRTNIAKSTDQTIAQRTFKAQYEMHACPKQSAQLKPRALSNSGEWRAPGVMPILIEIRPNEQHQRELPDNATNIGKEHETRAGRIAYVPYNLESVDSRLEIKMPPGSCQ
jgi:hypothetical protein